MRRSDPPSMNRKSLALAHFSMSWIAAAPNMGRIVGRKPFAIAGVLPAGPVQAVVGIGCLPPVMALRAFRRLLRLQAIWTKKPETARRVRGRINAILDAEMVLGHRAGANPARYVDHLQLVLPRSKQRSHVKQSSSASLERTASVHP